MSKYLIFSDTHFTAKFKAKYAEILSDLVMSADRVIIAGDFWDAFLCSFDNFITSKWSSLFKLLKPKTTYLFGNHDSKEYTDFRVNQFCFETKEEMELILENKSKLFIVHGNRICPGPDSKFNVKPNILFKLMLNVTEPFVRLLFKYFKLELILKLQNRSAKKYREKYFPDHILVMGHTHASEFDLKNYYINLGVNKYNNLTYLLIDTKTSKMELISHKI